MVAEPASVAVIGKGMVIKGQIRSGEHMHISGEIDGSLYLAGYDLTVTAESKVRADVTAREVDVSGSIQGNVDATRKITVRKGGKLIGDLRTPGIVIEDGAYFKGNIEIVTREPRKQGDESTPPVVRTTGATA
jgi:cytoskeletal protein CcmA (bactofilin family)